MQSTKLKTQLDRGADLSVIDLVDHMIENAQEMRASDIHIDPAEKAVEVRFRVDGVLQDAFNFPLAVYHEVVARIKVMSGLRTDEHAMAQDGRFRAMLEGAGPIDIRVSVVPTYSGESVVLRLLSDKEEQYSLESLGFDEADRKKILHAIHKPYGMILATGPTGSGKTTTLYTILKMLNTKDVSIVTIEDPIEYAVKGIKQIQANSRAGLTFASGLRSILRQDPNVIMVGEIRDEETAGIAVNTSLTGHLLLSTLHTNDAATTLPRLLDMKIEAYLVASTVNLAIGSRLVRRICEKCKEEKKMTAAEIESLKEALPDDAGVAGVEEGQKFYQGKGCKACNKTGYHGRVGIHEVLVVDDEAREAILRKASAKEIKDVAVRNGMTTMTDAGFAKARQGLTTVEEILRVIHE
jgi:type IV pilus assembly protein PilB